MLVQNLVSKLLDIVKSSRVFFIMTLIMAINHVVVAHENMQRLGQNQIRTRDLVLLKSSHVMPNITSKEGCKVNTPEGYYIYKLIDGKIRKFGPFIPD